MYILGDRAVEEIRQMRRDVRPSRRPGPPNVQSVRRPLEHSMRSTRINEKPYSRPMAMDYEDNMEWEETNRYSPTPVNNAINLKL